MIANLVDQLGHAMTGFIAHCVSQIVADPTTRSPS